MRSQTGFWIIALLVLAGCGPRKPASVVVDPDLAVLVSSDAVALSGVDLQALRKSPVWTKWFAPRIEQLGKENGADLAGQGIQILAFTDGKSAQMFAKTRSGVERLDSKQPLPPRRAGIPPALLDRMRTIPPQNAIWAVGVSPHGLLGNLLPESGNLANLRNIAEGIEDYTLGMDLAQGLKLRANAGYSSEEAAARVHDGLRGLVALAKLSTPKNRPELLRIYERIQITRERAALRVAADLSPEELNSVLGLAGAR